MKTLLPLVKKMPPFNVTGIAAVVVLVSLPSVSFVPGAAILKPAPTADEECHIFSMFVGDGGVGSGAVLKATKNVTVNGTTLHFYWLSVGAFSVFADVRGENAGGPLNDTETLGVLSDPPTRSRLRISLVSHTASLHPWLPLTAESGMESHTDSRNCSPS